MKKLLFLVAAALMLFACSKEDAAPELATQQDAADRTQVFYAEAAGTPAPGTKVYADNNLRLLWNSNDSLTIFNKSTQNSLYTFTGQNGDNAGGFEYVSSSPMPSAPATLADNYALYPYNWNASINDAGTQITTNLPEVQVYKENSFGIRANTMVAVCDGDDNHLSFKNVCGYLKIRLYGNNVKVASVRLQSNNNEMIAGPARITPSMDGDPTVSMITSAAATFNTITLRCPQPVTIGTTGSEATDFIFVVPPTTLANGFKLTVTDFMGGVFEMVTTNSLTIQRNTMESMSALAVVPNYSGVNVQFDDANFKAYCVENFDTDGGDGDGEVSIAEAQAATSIDLNRTIYHYTIQSLGGLECFTNLTYLDLGKQDIPSIDLSTLTKLENFYCYNGVVQQIDFSNNPELKEIIYQGGRSDLGAPLGQLASVNLPDNPNLERLWIIESNALTNIDLSHCPALKDLDLHHNQLTAIDVSPLTSLTELDCAQNQLTSLDVTALTNLTRLVCSFNQLSSIDLSHNTALTVLYVQQNQLTSLDVSANTGLEWLMCSYNKIGSLAIAHFNSLKRVYCGYNPFMTSVSCTYCPALITCDVTDNTALKSLELSTTKLESITGLKTCTALEELICQSSKVSTLDVSDMTSLKKVRVAWNQMTSLNVSGCTALKELVCRQNDLTSLDVSTNTALETLECQNNSLSSLDVTSNIALKELWCFKNSLQTLNLTYNRYLEILRCNDNQLTSVNLQYLNNQIHLTEIYIHNNSLSSLSLTRLTALEKLYCDNNQLSSLYVVNNTSLTQLAAWASGQTGSIRSLTKAMGMNITYLGEDHSTVIDPTGDPWNTLIMSQGSL